MTIVYCENKTYAAACLASEQLRQAADDAAQRAYAAGGTWAVFDSALKANVIADYRRRLASATANNLIEPMASNMAALAALGTGGV